MEYITLKQATKRYKKSLSTIRRIISQAPKNTLKEGEKLNTGKRKILVKDEYLHSVILNHRMNHREHTENKENHKKSELMDDHLNEPMDDHLKTLKKELQNKQQIIEKLLQAQERFLENEKNFQILIERNNQRVELLQQHFDNNRRKEENNRHKKDEKTGVKQVEKEENNNPKTNLKNSNNCEITAKKQQENSTKIETEKIQLTENKIPSDRASFNEWLKTFKDKI